MGATLSQPRSLCGQVEVQKPSRQVRRGLVSEPVKLDWPRARQSGEDGGKANQEESQRDEAPQVL